MHRVTESLLVQLVDRLPRSLFTRAFGAVSEIEAPAPLQVAVNEALSSIVGIDRDEALRPPSAHASLNGVFTRRLEPDARPLASTADEAVVSPVDGRLTRFGTIRQGTLFEVKGRRYDVEEILADPDDAQRFRDGAFATIYLSPRDYHRIHSPTTGRVERFRYLPGHLFPVNDVWIRNIDNLFAVNERIVSIMETEAGVGLGIIKVGAACVGRTTLTYSSFAPTDHDGPRREIELEKPARFEHGDELGVFNLGSTIVLLFEDSDFHFDHDLEENTKIRMGELLGRFGTR